MKCDCDAFSDDPCPSHGYGTMECECGVAIKAPLVVREGWDLMCSCRRRYIGVEDAAHGYWKPLTMPREDEARFRMHATVVPDMAALIAEIDALRAELDRCAEHLRSSVADEEARQREIDALRSLPVIARCYDCAHAETSPHADVCVHPAAGGRVEHGGKLPPPGNCPLRNGGAR